MGQRNQRTQYSLRRYELIFKRYNHAYQLHYLPHKRENEVKVFAIEHKYKTLSGKVVKEILLEGHPKRIIEDNYKIWKETHVVGHRFKIVQIKKEYRK